MKRASGLPCRDSFDPCRVSSTSRSSDIKCPYYRMHGAFEIRCKGITDDTRIALRFLSAEKLREHERIFCNNRYWCCELCRMLDQIEEEDQ